MRVLIAITMLLGAAACGIGKSGPRATGRINDYPIAAPMDRAWVALIEVFTDLNIPVKTMERASGFLQSDQMYASRGGRTLGRRNEDVWDCGKGTVRADAQSDSIEYRLSAVLKPAADGGSAVRTSVTAVGFDRERDRQTCVSRGVIEAMIAEAVQKKSGASP